jgi:integrase/recombinase XerD
MTPLRRRMIEDMQIRNLAPRTQVTYVEQIDRFARHFRQSPERLGLAEIRAWQIYLAQDKRLAASSISVAVAALRFNEVPRHLRRRALGCGASLKPD